MFDDPLGNPSLSSGKPQRNNNAVKPLAQALHKKLAEAHRTAVEAITNNPDRWEPMTSQATVPTDAELLSTRGKVNPRDKIFPCDVWAAPFSVCFHWKCKIADVKSCYIFGSLSSTQPTTAYMCVDKASRRQAPRHPDRSFAPQT